MPDLIGNVIIPIATVIGTSFVTWRIAKKELSNSLDGKSEWRKRIFDAASKTDMTLDDVYLLRTALRYKARQGSVLISSQSDEEMLTFDNITYTMIEFCEHTVENNGSSEYCKFNLDIKTSEKIRIYFRYLLKENWDSNLQPSFKLHYWNIWKRKKRGNYIKETLEMIEEQDVVTRKNLGGGVQ